MGYSHGRKWTDELIESEIISVMKSLGIERMPSNKECINVTGNYALSNRISKTLGFYGWAEKLKLKKKESETLKAIEFEKEISEKIKKETGLKAKVTATKSPFDILVNDNVKIEVKYSFGFKDAYYTANLYKGVQKSDVLIFVCKNDVLGNKTLIIPSNHLQGITQLSIGKNSKYDKYIDCWEYIEQFNEFMENLY